MPFHGIPSGEFAVIPRFTSLLAGRSEYNLSIPLIKQILWWRGICFLRLPCWTRTCLTPGEKIPIDVYLNNCLNGWIILTVTILAIQCIVVR